MSVITKDLDVSVNAASSEENRAMGIKTPGVNRHTTYTDSSGNIRNKVEVLVASKSIVDKVVTKPAEVKKTPAKKSVVEDASE